MKKYYVNKNAQANGDHEVHVDGCTYMPISKLDLGYHLSCTTAVSEAKKTYPKSNGCFYCSLTCHTG